MQNAYLDSKETLSSLKQPIVFNFTNTGASKAAACCCLCLSWSKRLEYVLPLQVLARKQPTFLILSTENGFIAGEV